MRTFRIAPQKYAEDLSGSGAKLAGGRWNPKGLALVYTSTTAALAALEVLVHCDWNVMEELVLVEIEVPDDQIQDLRTFLDIPPSGRLPLPGKWNVSPPPPVLAEMGKKWIASRSSIGLLVPSVHFPDGPELNLLLNPAHPRFGDVKVQALRKFRFDGRLKS